MKTLLLTMFLITCSNLSFAQIELNINKLENDSFKIYFTEEPDFEMNKLYKFIVKTNIVKTDSLYVNLDLDRNKPISSR